MDTLTMAEVGLGSAALTTALIAWLKNLGVAPSQKVILLWAMVIPIGVQVLLVLSQNEPVTVQTIAQAVLAGITSGLAAGGLHDYTSAAAAKVKRAHAASPFSDEAWQRSLDFVNAHVQQGLLTEEQGRVAKEALAKGRLAAPGMTPPV